MRNPAAGLGLLAGFVAGAVVMVAVSLFTAPKPEEELQGLVYGTRSPGMEEPPAEVATRGTAGRRCSAGARSCWPPPATSRSRSDDRRTDTGVRLPRAS